MNAVYVDFWNLESLRRNLSPCSLSPFPMQFKSLKGIPSEKIAIFEPQQLNKQYQFSLIESQHKRRAILNVSN